MPATRGQPVLYNESTDPDNPAWTGGQVLMDDTAPTPDQVSALVDATGNYPAACLPDQVFIGYYSILGASTASAASSYAYEGTGPQQYQTV